ncbi:hypothetical protein Pmani_017970 [Petrolisthes manimaculis]|uniref:Uncharacterized protein n=1 Tax=Petrolisthes manimaculis TaxID=1843537 RepID=A0AAE1PLC3_9EUCA|nr:hypothetical protein Pmani_017970 [Petrolisthes manimaculis]
MPWEPRGRAVRLVAGLWMVAAFLLGVVYRSNLKAMLIVQSITLPFDSIEELVEAGFPTAVVKDSSIHRDIMAADDEEILGRLRKQILVYGGKKVIEGIVNSLDGLHPCIGITTALQDIIQSDFSRLGRCRVYMMSNSFLGPLSLSFAFPKGSTLKHQVDPIIRGLRESGVLAKILSKSDFKATVCLKPISSSLISTNHRPLIFADLHGIITLYSVGKFSDAVFKYF